MRVCLVSKEVGGISGGGIGVYVREAAKALSAGGHEVWLVTRDPGFENRGKLRLLTGFHRTLIAGENVDASRRPKFFHAEPYYGYSTLVHETLQATGVEFDYIEFPDYEAEGVIPIREQRLFGSYRSSVLAVMLHSPMFECLSYDQQMHRVSLVVREVCLLEDDAIRNAPVLNCPSRGLWETVARRLGLADRSAAIIRYPMQLSSDLPAPTAARASLEQLRFLYFGRVEPRKGVENLIEAFRQLPDLRLRLVGGDVPFSPYGRSYRAYLERRSPPNVEFVGPVARERMLELIRETDVCVLPSLFENWPNACIEAMAAGRVVVGSCHGGMAEMIEHGQTGFIVDGRQTADIVRVIREDLAAALPRLDEIGASAAARIRVLSAQETYVDAIQERVDRFRATAVSVNPIPRADCKVSIVIPFYNDRDTIDDAVQSACAQTYDNLEIVIVNDGSPLSDASELLARQRTRDPRIRIIDKPNGGLSSARNCGVAHASGEYVLFLDADNKLHSDYASVGVDVLERGKAFGFAVPHAEFVDGASGTPLGIYNPIPFDRTICLVINRFGDAGAMFRRSLFTDHGVAYDEMLIAYEDWALWMDLDRMGVRGVAIPRVLYEYRVRRDSLVHALAPSNHKALMGLLINRHYPAVDERERGVLVTLFQVAGDAVHGRGEPGVRESVSMLRRAALRAGRTRLERLQRAYRGARP